VLLLSGEFRVISFSGLPNFIAVSGVGMFLKYCLEKLLCRTGVSVYFIHCRLITIIIVQLIKALVKTQDISKDRALHALKFFLMWKCSVI
jgi:hypothetical protein